MGVFMTAIDLYLFQLLSSIIMTYDDCTLYTLYTYDECTLYSFDHQDIYMTVAYDEDM